MLGSLPWQGGVHADRQPPTVRCEAVLEDMDGDRELVDEVRSFDPIHRSYGRRRVRHQYFNVVNLASQTRLVGHDPMALVEGD